MKKVLVVDDEAHILNILKFNLIKKGFDVVTASEGALALQLMQSLVPDLLIIDVMMPKMSGYDVCAELKKDSRFTSMPIIMLSAKSQTADLQKAEEIGVTFYFTKPFSPLAVVNKAAELTEVKS
ncbi:MAG: response regulator [Candidatus Wallbacteria bacterium]|nr:response regulator [Candidatus Wallbacteria bacterium]